PMSDEPASGDNDMSSHGAPIGDELMVLRAKRIAPSQLIAPAPCVSESYSAPASSRSRSAVCCNTALIAFGGSARVGFVERFAWMLCATRPLVTPAAMLVPLSVR